MNPAEEKCIEASEIENSEEIKLDKLHKLRKDRLAALSKDMNFKEEWIANKHGEYTTIASDKEFVDAIKKSERVVIHCYYSSSKECDIIDTNLNLLAKKHIETKFCKLDVEKSFFLCRRLGIRVFPTILLCTGAKEKTELTVDFGDCTGGDNILTHLEWIIARSGLIKYDGDLTSPPDANVAERPKRSIFTHVKESIRDSDEDSDSEGQGDH